MLGCREGVEDCLCSFFHGTHILRNINGHPLESAASIFTNRVGCCFPLMCYTVHCCRRGCLRDGAVCSRAPTWDHTARYLVDIFCNRIFIIQQLKVRLYRTAFIYFCEPPANKNVSMHRRNPFIHCSHIITNQWSIVFIIHQPKVCLSW